MAQKEQGGRRQSFLQGALILTMGIIIVKIIGALFKIPLNGIITEDGMGYFNTAYAFYSPLFALATAGFPIAIARMVSENYTLGRYRDVRTVLRASRYIFIVTGTLGMVIMWIGAVPYTSLSKNPGALPAMMVLAPAILFSCLSSIYRGYYTGLRDMYPSALSEIIEALIKLIVGLIAAYLVIHTALAQYAAGGTVFGTAVESEAYAKAAALPYAAAAAIFGISFGSLISFLYLKLRHSKKGDGIARSSLRDAPPSHTMNYTVVRLIKTAVPIGIGALAVNIALSIDSIFLQRGLSSITQSNPQVLLDMYAGSISKVALENTEKLPNFLFGCYGNALTVFMLVPAITQAFGSSALPSVTDAWTRGNKKEIKSSIESVLRITALFSIPAGLGLSVLCGPVAGFIFSSSTGVAITAKVLGVLGIGAIFASLSTPINSMLQAVGRVDLPVKILVGALSVKVLLDIVLCAVPKINVLGAALGTLVCYFIVVMLAVYYLAKCTRVRINLVTTFVKPGMSAGICCLAAYLVQNVLYSLLHSSRLATIAALLVAAVVYVLCLLLTRTISRSDVQMLPKGEKIAQILEKHNWIE